MEAQLAKTLLAVNKMTQALALKASQWNAPHIGSLSEARGATVSCPQLGGGRDGNQEEIIERGSVICNTCKKI